MNASKGRILCVDDEPHVLRALQWLLRRDFEVHVANGVQEALRLIAANDFDVVVSDQRMPGVTGVELLREVRQRAPRAMRVLLTGYADLDAMVRSVNESEVFRFITKPWDIRELPKLIAEAAEVARSEAVPRADPEEEPESGATNVVPLRAPAQACAPRHEVTTVALHGTESVLLVDDDREVHSAVAQVVGNTVRLKHAYNLPEAVRMLNDGQFGIILSEVKVGNIDATRLVRLMKARRPEIVSVVFSAEKDAEVVMTLINQGQVYRFIPKPFKPGYIRIVLNSALKRHRQLLETPGLRRRFAVEEAPRSAADSLLQDVREAAVGGGVLAFPAAAGPAVSAVAPFVAPRPCEQASGGGGSVAEESVVGRLTTGFRRLFGA